MQPAKLTQVHKILILL